MIIKTKIDFKEYMKLMYVMSYKKRAAIIVSIIGFFLLAYSIYDLPTLLSSKNNSMAIFRLSIGFYGVVGFPLTVYKSAKKNFESNARFKENVSYEFLPEEIKITGESFNSRLEWSKTYKIEELKNWFLIYQSQQIGNMIPKSSMTVEQVAELKAIFKNLKGIEVKLK